MNLFINSPSYYTAEYGVCDEIYQLCWLLSKEIDIKKYTNSIDTIGITPIIAPKNILDIGEHQEVKKISLTYRFAGVSDYDEYLNADINGKKDIIIDNILRSLYVIKKALRKNFDYDKIKEDIILVLKQSSYDYKFNL